MGAVAAGVVTFMVVWMRRHARDLSGELRRSAGAALASGSAAALVAIAFFAVVRDGLETVVFLLAVFQNADDPLSAGVGALLGLSCAVVIGALIYRAGVRLNMARFFRFAGAVLVLVAVGLVASTLHTAHEAGWVNFGQAQALDLSWLVVPGSWTSALLTGMLGWQPQPTVAELVGYVACLVPAAIYVLWPARRRLALRRRATQAAGLSAMLLLIVLAVAGCGGSSSSGGSAGAREAAFKLTDAGCDPAQMKLDAGRTTFKVTNAGPGRVSELEVLQGSRILGEKEHLAPGLSGSFTSRCSPASTRSAAPAARPARPACSRSAARP